MLTSLLTIALLQAAPPTPVVVELYSSEGCSSCPQAERALAALQVPGVEVIALERHVDYWNDLGWVDPFSSAESSRAQQRADTLRGYGLYTPQLIVDGRVAFSSGRKLEAEVITAAERIAPPTFTMTLALEGRTLTARVDGVRAPRVEFFLVESNLVSQVRRGENAGATLAHAPVVRQAALGSPCGEDGGVCPLPSSSPRRVATFQLDPAWAVKHLAVVAVGRESEAGPVITAIRKAIAPGVSD
jgi:hypothetical protein